MQLDQTGSTATAGPTRARARVWIWAVLSSFFLGLPMVDAPPAAEVGAGALTNATRLAELNAAAWHDAGITGAGVKVGIIDSGFGSTGQWDAAAGAGELPARASVGTFCRTNGVTGCAVFNGETHGLGVAEIIADVAPGAQLYLAVALRRDDVGAALDHFAAQGVQVVSRSGWAPYDGPGNGTGPSAQLVDDAVADGMFVAHSAGNLSGPPTQPAGWAGSHFRQTWSDPDSDNWMNFAGGGEALAIGCSSWTGLRWSDWGEAQPSNYDAYVFSQATGGTQWKAYEAVQDDASDPMVEVDGDFPYPVCGGNGGTGYLRIQRKVVGNGADTPDVLEFATNGGGITTTGADASVLEYTNARSATMGIVDSRSPGMMAVGALNWPTSGDPVDQVHLASAQGPTEDGRIKPDIVARPCYQTTQGACFAQTSGATPIVAGAAALALSAGVAKDPSTVRRYLVANAIDREAGGADNKAGQGEVRLPAPPVMPAALPTAPTALVATPGTGSVGLTWTAPAATGGLPLLGYLAVVKLSATGVVLRATDVGVGTSTTLSSLADGSYTVELWPRTARGFGAKASAGPFSIGGAVTPNAPSITSFSVAATAVTVNWSAPTGPFTGFRATAHLLGEDPYLIAPQGSTTVGSGARTAVINGLQCGQTYRVRVQTFNGAVASTYSVGVNATPGPCPVAGKFHAVTPARILDTRPTSQIGPFNTKFGPAQARTLQVTGTSGVPTGATAVIINVTAVFPSTASFLSITPTPPAPGTPITTSNLNLTPGTVRPNLVVAKLTPTGQIAIYNNSGTVDVLADVVGWFDDGTITGDRLTAITPARILDTRPATQIGPFNTKFGPGQPRTLQVTGTSGVPTGATAVTLNVTSVNATTDSHISLTPDPVTPGISPPTSNLNVAAGQVRPNLVVVKLDPLGRVTIYNHAGNGDILADVVGYFSPTTGNPVTTITPARILDTRPGPEQTGLPGPFGPGQPRTLQVAGRGGVPANATSVWLNITAVNPTTGTHISLTPDPVTPGISPPTSNLNLTAGQVIPNLVLVKLDPLGRVTIYNNTGTTDILADTIAYST